MQSVLAGTDVTLTGPFNLDGKEPVVPDTGSVTYSVWDHEGTPIAGLVNLPVTTSPTSFQYQITIPASYNVIESGKIFGRHTLVVNYTKNGMTRGISVPYRITPYLNYTASGKDVRAFIGVNENELPDADLDLLTSYLMVDRDFGETYLSDALSSGTIHEVYANDAIVMRTVIDIIPSLKSRIAQSESNGVKSFDRPKITDFNEVLAAAYARYFRNRELVVSIGEVAVDMILITTTQDTDVITGE